MELIHYGAPFYKPELFTPINNEHRWFKPSSGGLWTSPINSKHSWKHWTISSQFKNTPINFKLSINTNKILIIDSYKDLEKALKITTNKHGAPLIKSLRLNKYLDYEFIATKYDAIHLTAKGEKETRYSYPYNLNGFDCETVFILNKDVIEI